MRMFNKFSATAGAAFLALSLNASDANACGKTNCGEEPKPTTPPATQPANISAQGTGTATSTSKSEAVAGAAAGASAFNGGNTLKQDINVGGPEIENTTNTTIKQNTVLEGSTASATTGPVTANGGNATGGTGGQGGTATNEGNTVSGGNVTGGNTSNVIEGDTYKAGAAANIPGAAAILAVKECSSTFTFGIGGGNVMSGYGGVSWGYTPSGAVELKGTDKDGNAVSYTVPEFVQMKPQRRAELTSAMSSGDAKTASCLASAFAKQKYALDMSYSIAALQEQTKAYVAELNHNTSVDVARVQEAGKNLHEAMKHFCGNATGAHDITIPTGGTNPAKMFFDKKEKYITEHGFCFNTAQDLTKFLINTPLTNVTPTRPNFDAPAFTPSFE